MSKYNFTIFCVKNLRLAATNYIWREILLKISTNTMWMALQTIWKNIIENKLNFDEVIKLHNDAAYTENAKNLFVLYNTINVTRLM